MSQNTDKFFVRAHDVNYHYSEAEIEAYRVPTEARNKCVDLYIPVKLCQVDNAHEFGIEYFLVRKQKKLRGLSPQLHSLPLNSVNFY